MRSSQGLCKTGTHFSGPFAKDLGKVLKSKDCSSGNYICVKGENSFFFSFFFTNATDMCCKERRNQRGVWRVNSDRTGRPPSAGMRRASARTGITTAGMHEDKNEGGY